MQQRRYSPAIDRERCDECDTYCRDPLGCPVGPKHHCNGNHGSRSVGGFWLTWKSVMPPSPFRMTNGSSSGSNSGHQGLHKTETRMTEFPSIPLSLCLQTRPYFSGSKSTTSTMRANHERAFQARFGTGSLCAGNASLGTRISCSSCYSGYTLRILDANTNTGHAFRIQFQGS